IRSGGSRRAAWLARVWPAEPRSPEEQPPRRRIERVPKTFRKEAPVPPDSDVQKRINAIRMLSIDAVQKANSGHPGLPLGAAAMAFALWTRHMRFNPKDPHWPNRDRFVLSAGHGSMLLYSLLYLTGYDVSLDDLKQFRQLGSKTPRHPEYAVIDG